MRNIKWNSETYYTNFIFYCEFVCIQYCKKNVIVKLKYHCSNNEIIINVKSNDLLSHNNRYNLNIYIYI